MSFDAPLDAPTPDDDRAGAPPEPREEIEVARTPQGERRSEVTESEEIDYEPPSTDLLEQGGHDPGPDTRDRETVGRALLETLGHFGVDAEMVGTVIGPHVSRYELRLAPGTKVNKVTQLKDDLAYALASTDIRILAPIPGKQAIGVEVPNQRRRIVRLGDIYQGRPKGSSPIVGWLGKDIAGTRGVDRPREDAPRPRRGDHRIGEVGVHQRDPQLDPAARVAERRPLRARRPEAGGAEPLRADPTPPDAGRDASRGSPPTCSPT